MDELITHLKERFSVYDIITNADGQVFLSLDAPKLVPLLASLKANHGFTVLVIYTAVDWIEEGKFQLTYIVNNPKTKQDLGIRIYISRENATMDSIHHLWKHAATFQREMKEMFGINFPGSPRLNDPFILEGWDNIPPMRKEFDTKKYSEETYFPRPGRETNDPSAFMKKKLYPDE